jgi:hypothetical protein
MFDVCPPMWAHDALAVLPRDVEARQVSAAHAALLLVQRISLACELVPPPYLIDGWMLGSLVRSARRLSLTWTSS